jgi:rubrerythrin
MDKKLQLEINRAKEIMKLPLLNEGIPGATADLFRRFFKTTDEAENLLGRIAREANMDESVIDDVVRVMDNPDIYDSLSAVRKRNFFRLMSQVPNLSDELFDGVLETFSTNIDELNLAVYELVNGPEKLTYLQSINKLFAEAPEVMSLIRRKHGRQFADFDPSKSAKVADDVVDEVSGILDDIDATPVSDEDVLGSIDEILNPDTWEEEVSTLTDTMAADLAKSSRFKAAFQKIAELFKFTKNQKQQIETLAQTLSDPDVSSDTKQKVLKQLEKKLESVYYNNMNGFVQLRDYFDDVAVDDKKFKLYWDKLRKDSKNDIAFWSTFGKKAKDTKPAWLRAITGFKDEFKSIFELERKIFNGVRSVFRKLNKSSVETEAIKGFENSLGNLFKSGTRRGFPTLTNENYTKLIQAKGPVAAKVVYLRDLGVNYIRYATYVSLLEFLRNVIADELYKQQILDCAQSQKGKTNEQDDTEITNPCEGLDNWWDMMWVKWALQRRPNLEKTLPDSWQKEFSKIFYNNLKPWKSTTGPDKHWFWALVESDPGFVGETLNIAISFGYFFDEQLDRTRDINSADQLRKELDELLNKTKQKLEETGDKIVDEANEVVDEVVNDTGVIPQGLKDAVPDKYENQLERVNGVWIFHDAITGDDYKLKKGKGLKNNPTEYPFKDESKRNGLEDDRWYALLDKKGNGKYEVFDLAEGLKENNMKRKGLGILLEQFNQEDAEVDGGSSGSSGSGGSGTNTTDVKTQETKRKRQLEDQMLAMFEKIEINDRDSERNMIDKLTDSDKSVIVKDSFDALINHYGGILKIKDELVDDTVVGNSVNYLIKDKKMEPFKIVYKSPLKLDAKIMESKGLESILYEQGVTVSYNTIYINYPDGTEDLEKIEFIRGGKSEKIALDNYNKRFYPDQKVDDSQATPPSERDKNTTEVSEVRPEVRPEEAMGIKTPKMMKKQMNNEKS